jgi:predicted esterase
MPQPPSRRRFGSAITGLLGVTFAAGCDSSTLEPSAPTLNARPSAVQTSTPPGTHSLAPHGMRGGVLQVPPLGQRSPVPLLVLFHGAGGDGTGLLEWLQSLADTSHLAVLAPDSIGRTWDAVLVEQRDVFDLFAGTRRLRGFGADVTALDDALRRVFATVAIDPNRVVAAGFSDGATYALSLGLANGELFRRIVAFSPGFVVDGERRGQPEIFITHGRRDRILPIDRCSRRIVPQLEAANYAVTYREFDSGHELPGTITQEAIAWASR